mgnify:CR=1 FL=1
MHCPRYTVDCRQEVLRLKRPVAIVMLALAIALILTGCTHAVMGLPQYGAVAGKVVDEAGNGIPQAKVSINKTDLFALSNENGCFVIESVPSGRYLLSVSCSGYRNCVRYISVSAGQESTIIFTMCPDAPDDPGEPGGEYPYAASKNSDVFHRRSCSYTSKIKPTNLVLFKTREAAVASGRRPCKVCRP